MNISLEKVEFIFFMNKTKLICLLVIVLTVPFKSNLQSQNTTHRFERIGKEKGLYNTSINYIIQDRKGYMWFATYGGIYRYDGYNLKNYAQDPKNKNGLSSNIIEYLLIFLADKLSLKWHHSKLYFHVQSIQD